MSLLKRFENYIQRNNLFLPKDKLLLAVSGGVDSVVLCELCKQAGYDFAIAHCNFQLRGKDSEKDEEFVKQLAAKYGTEFFVKKFDTKRYAEEKKVSIQEAARVLRYEWFEELMTPDPIAIGSGLPTPGYLLTAHHADDNIETVLMNFFRGTGIKGLKGIEPKHGHIVRPLLFARKKELEEFLHENKLEYVEDYTNKEDDYTRNYFRNQLIPSIEKVFPEVKENLLANIGRFKESVVLYQQAIDVHKKKLLELKSNEVHIPVLKLKKTEPLQSITYEIIKDFGFTSHQLIDIMNLLDSESGKYIQSPTHRIIKNRNWLIIVPNEPKKAETILIENGINKLEFGNGILEFETYPYVQSPIPDSTATAFLNADEIRYPLLLRKWKQGDYFYPLGMKKKKKLVRFFIDQKLSKTDKEKVWVLESDKRILWIVGHRIDDRFKITEKTKNGLKVSFLTS